MASHNLKQQIDHAIHESFKPGMSKHSFKCENGRDYGNIIFSHSELKGLKDLSKNFCNFMKANYPEIKMVKDIRQEHLDSFIIAKSKDCRGTTLKTYATNLEKIGKCCNKQYNMDLKSWHIEKDLYQKKTTSKDEPKLRTLAMDKKDFEKVMKIGRECQSKQALDVCYHFGLRSREVVLIEVKDVKENSLVVEHGKGGRRRELQADTPEKKACLERLKEHISKWCIPVFKNMESTERVFKIESDSVNNYLNTNLRKAGITKYNEAKTGIHAIRKAFATSEYKRFREQGLSHKEAWGNVSEELGHGRDRNELFKIYVK